LNTVASCGGFREGIMSGKQFLNPAAKLIICLLMAVIMGYFFYLSMEAAEYYEKTTWIRGAVFFGFVYLFVNALRQTLAKPSQ
jgi:hypothetical protein